MPIVPLFGRGTKGRSSNVSAQRRINLYTEQPNDQDKSGAVLYSRPGLYPKLFEDNGPGFGGGPFRGVIVTQRVLTPGTPTQRVVDIVFGAVTNDAVVSVNNADGFTVTPDVFQTSSGPVVYADDGIQVVAVDGRSAYTAAYGSGTYTLSDIGDSTGIPAGATSVCAIASRFVFNDPANKGRFWYSDPLSTTVDGTSFYTAESFPDPLVSVYSWRGELILFGSTSIEFWAPAPSPTDFSRTGGSGVDWGLAAPDTVREVEGRLFFLARNSGSDVKVVALNGYQAEPLSDPEVEYDINRNLTGPINACVIRKSGTTFYVLNLGDKTWALNVYTGEWGEWQTAGGRFAGQYSFFAHGRQSITDYRSAAVYGVSPDAFVDGDESMKRELTTRHLFHDLDRITVRELRLDVETGLRSLQLPARPRLGGPGHQPPAPAETVDPQIVLQVSKDGGHTWSNEMWESLGRGGEYSKSAVWRNLGRARDFVFRFRVTDPVKVVLLGASVRVE